MNHIINTINSKTLKRWPFKACNSSSSNVCKQTLFKPQTTDLKSKYKMYIPLFSLLTYTFAHSRIPALVEGARILAVETNRGKSHRNLMSSILRALVDNGVARTQCHSEHSVHRRKPSKLYRKYIWKLWYFEDIIDKYGSPIKVICKMSQKSRMKKV